MTAGAFHPEGRLDRDVFLRRLDRVSPGASATAYADPWVVLATSAGSPYRADARCTFFDGHLENRCILAATLGMAEDAPAAAVVHAAEAAWPETFAQRLRGSFVVALWDTTRRSGLLAVDQLGGRSLFYTIMPDGALLFASELVTLLCLLPVRPAPDPTSVAAWLLDHRLSYGTTLYRGVRRLGAAHALELGPSGRNAVRYWSPRYDRPLEGMGADLSEALWDHVVRAVDSKAEVSDRPAVILSGGVDSSVAAAAAVEAAAGRKPAPRAYSAVFPDIPSIDESDRIDAVVDFLDLDSVEMHLRPSGALALAFEYVDSWSLPLPGPGAALEQPLVERAVAEGATVILDGQAGDELFGQARFLIADRLRHGRVAASYALAASMLPSSVTGLDKWRYAFQPWKFFGLQAAIPRRLHESLRGLRGRERTLPAWFAAPPGTFDVREPSPWPWKEAGVPRWWAHRAFVTARMRDISGANDYLRHRAWAVGADARPPLLDVDLVEFVLRLPPELSFRSSYADRPLIRDAMRGRLPDLVRLNRVKSNVAAFYYETIAGPDLAPARRLLADGTPEIGAYTDMRAVRELLYGHRPAIGEAGWYDWFGSIWRLASTEIWLREEADPGFAGRARSEPDVLATIRSDHRVRRRVADSSFFPPCATTQPV